MAIPSDALETDIINRGLSDAGVDGSITYQADAVTWFRDAKVLIYSKVRKQKFLEQTKITVLTKGVSSFGVPQDFDELYKISLLKGGTKYTAQDGALGSITLSASDSISEGSAVGARILILAGTNVGEYRQVSAYDTTTRIATISEDWSNAADSTSEYLFITKVEPLSVYRGGLADGDYEHIALGEPLEYAEYDEEFIFYPTPDKSEYGILLRYYSNIIKANNTDVVYTRFLNRCEGVLRQYIYFCALKKMDDSEAKNEERTFYGMLRNLLGKETYSSNELTRRVKR